tara:strand:+ start:286 stop:633 length:348 start_codon:yes stop_codon:yes gene_type:complete
MAEQYETLSESLSRLPVVYSAGHEHAAQIHREAGRYVNRTIDHIEQDTQHELDTYDIEHGLSKADLRILLKIVAKELPDCGRKRGAILRYIKAYAPETNNDNRKLYNILNNETQT